jgi:NitT/TauT family transport system substrate-binding protein
MSRIRDSLGSSTPRALVVASISSLVLLAATGCSSGSSTTTSTDSGSEELRPVVVGANPISDIAPLWVGDAAGIFEKHGIDLTIETAGGGAALLPSVVSGQFQFAFANPTTLMVAAENGLDVKVVSNLASSTGEEGSDGSAVLVADDSSIQDAADLAGKTVAVNTFNSIGTTVIRESVRQAGGEPDDVEFVEIGFGDMMASLANGNIDAAWEVEPFISSSVENGYRAVSWPYIDVSPTLPIALAFTSGSLASSDPELVSDFADALSESIDYSNENPDKVREIIPTFTALKADQVDTVFFPTWTPDIDQDAVEKLADLAVSDGVLKEDPDLKKLLP